MTRYASLLAAAGAAIIFAAPASAHAMLERASPAVGSIVTKAPTEIRLEFDEGVEAVLSHISLTAEGGKAAPLGAPASSGDGRRFLTARTTSPLVAGKYRVAWRVVSVDGHVTEGDFSFTIKP